MLCPNCMSPYVKPFLPEDASIPDEPMLECTECDWVGPVTEFVPEIYR
ncbi:MAG TPA: hypothetical protein VGO97_02120 [Solirubrobacterales bacterium]|nr:hypothetical protein [Solirubrobacterales bacterium]